MSLLYGFTQAFTLFGKLEIICAQMSCCGYLLLTQAVVKLAGCIM